MVVRAQVKRTTPMEQRETERGNEENYFPASGRPTSTPLGSLTMASDGQTDTMRHSARQVYSSDIRSHRSQLADEVAGVPPYMMIVPNEIMFGSTKALPAMQGSSPHKLNRVQTSAADTQTYHLPKNKAIVSEMTTI